MSKLYVEKVHDDAKLPVQATTYSACYDVHAYLDGRDVSHYSNYNAFYATSVPSVAKPYTRLAPNNRAMIPTGIKVSTDPGYRVSVYPRSGLSLKQGTNLVNCVGIVDADFGHELMVLLHNTSDVEVCIHHNDRIAQIEVTKLEDTEIVEGQLPILSSNRNGGFGHTGH